MTVTDFLKGQIRETRNFTNSLIAEIPNELWFQVPDAMNSNIAWQVGHILLAQNYHAISCVHGLDTQIFEHIPVADLARKFAGLGSNERSVSVNEITKTQLSEFSYLVFNRCIDKLSGLDESKLSEVLEPTPFKNPIAKTKYDALSWSFKHEMWHCAEIEQIKIALNYQHRWIS